MVALINGTTRKRSETPPRGYRSKEDVKRLVNAQIAEVDFGAGNFTGHVLSGAESHKDGREYTLTMLSGRFIGEESTCALP
jgi:hypothetical protein